MIDTLLYATTGMAVVGALAAWACTRNQAARLRDLQERIDSLDDILAEVEQAIRPALPATTVVESPLVVSVDTSDLYTKVADDIRTDLAKAKALGLAYGVRPEGKSPGLAAPFTGDAKHPLYAKTGLPNQPVASLRPDPSPCTKCGKPRVWKQGWMNGKTLVTRPWCESCEEAELSDGTLVYCGYRDDAHE